MDFEPVSEFAIDILATVRLPDRPSTISTNVLERARDDFLELNLD